MKPYYVTQSFMRCVYMLICYMLCSFVLNYDFFSQQCKPVINDSVLPYFSYLTNEKIEQIPIENEDIIITHSQVKPK